MRRILKRFALAAAFSCLATIPDAHAEPSNLDAKALRLMRDVPNSGVIFLEVRIAEQERPGLRHCQGIDVRIKSETGVVNTITVQNSPMLFGKILDGATYGGATVIEAGVHTVERISCRDASAVLLVGPFARFTLQVGQIVNLGSLAIVYEVGTFQLLNNRKKGDWRVVDLSPTAATSLAKRLPETFAKAKKQHMTAIREGSKQ